MLTWGCLGRDCAGREWVKGNPAATEGEFAAG